jgi:hypothetical protein
MLKRKVDEETGIIHAWETFWGRIEARSSVHASEISMFNGPFPEENYALVEQALRAQAVESAVRDLDTVIQDDFIELQRMLTFCDESDSFMRILLRVDALQIPLLDLLLEYLSEHAHKQSPESAVVCSLILRHIRWIDFIQDSSDLVQKLFQMFSTFPLELQKDVIQILPELVSEKDFSVMLISNYQR